MSTRSRASSTSARRASASTCAVPIGRSSSTNAYTLRRQGLLNRAGLAAGELRELPVTLQRLPDRVATGSDRAGDPSKRFALSAQSNCFGSLPPVEASRLSDHAAISEVARDGGTVHLLLDGKSRDRRTAEVIVDELVYLSRGSERSEQSQSSPRRGRGRR